MKAFNFFEILGKDNKELVRSAFISYLVCEDAGFRAYLGLPEVELCKPQLECARSAAKSLRSKKTKIRIDVEIQSTDGNHIILIENKFKSAPNQKQLDDYDWIYKKLSKDEKTFNRGATFHKLLFCFHKPLAIIKSDTWKVWDYQDVLDYLESRTLSMRSSEELMFAQHYASHLRGYLELYRTYMTDARTLLEKKDLNKDDKFWLRMINSNLHVKCLEHFENSDIKYLVNPGNTSVPLLSIIPADWEAKIGVELLIQVQGNDLKCYVHSNDTMIISRLISIVGESFNEFDLKPKILGKRKSHTCYIFKVSILDSFSKDKRIGLEDIFGLINLWYERIDQRLVDNYIKANSPTVELVS